MAFHVEIDPEAVEEIEAIYQWIADRSPERALRWFNNLNAAVETLQHTPRRCPLAPESDAFQERIHQLHYGRKGAYRILFTISGKTVQVLRVRHGARPALAPEDFQRRPSRLTRRPSDLE